MKHITPAEFWSQLEQQERERKAIKPLTEEQKLAADLSYARNGKVREQGRDHRALADQQQRLAQQGRDGP